MDEKPLVLDKHKRYGKTYGKNELYWGLGIECESYFEMSVPKLVSKEFMMNHHKRERYSVDYFTSYKPGIFSKTISRFNDIHQDIPLPILVNAHFLQKCDASGEHKTLYLKGAPLNPNYSGASIFDLMKKRFPEFFQDKYEQSFTFDGDSVELITQNFYKTNIKQTVAELISLKKDFKEKLQTVFKEEKILQAHGKPKWIKGNHGFAVMATNSDNLSIFNNGTYHINITLPTILDSNGKIEDFDRFIKTHQNFIRILQWFEPLLVANLGSPDPCAWIEPSGFALGTQRGALSRYIGLGTYDTTTMKSGKLLTIDTNSSPSKWYDIYHKESNYEPLKTTGLDINFNKHWNHGVEVRFFDWFPEGRLQGVLRFLIYLADTASEKEVENPLSTPLWNTWMVRVVHLGADAGVSKQEAEYVSKMVGLECRATKDAAVFFADLYYKLHKKYNTCGPCSKYLVGCTPYELYTPSVSPVETGFMCFFRQKKKSIQDLLYGLFRRGGGVGVSGSGGKATS